MATFDPELAALLGERRVMRRAFLSFSATMAGALALPPVVRSEDRGGPGGGAPGAAHRRRLDCRAEDGVCCTIGRRTSVLVDHWERTGLLSSSFTGYRFATRQEVIEARDGGMDVEEVVE